MATQPTRFPLLPDGKLTSSMEDKPVVLDGQKVIFDKKITLTPVELEPAGPAPNRPTIQR